MKTIRSNPKYLIILALAVFLYFSCASTRGIFNQQDLWQQYQQAINDARVAESSEIVKNLLAIVPSDSNLSWENNYVLVVTWTSSTIYDGKVGEQVRLVKSVWVTVVPELVNFFHQNHIAQTDLTLRLEQLLGLPPFGGKNKFVEMWVNPRDLVRPSPDPEISDHEAELIFPVSEKFITIDEEYKNWFNHLQETSYGEKGYPWTRLGYTYDWGNPEHEVGLSEFVIWKGATVKIHSITDTAEYLK